MSIKRVAFLGTSRSGLGHLRRLATIGKRLRAMAPDIVISLITNAPPDGLSETDRSIFAEVLVCERADMAHCLGARGFDLAVLDTLQLPGIAAYTGPSVLILRETPDNLLPDFARDDGRPWNAVILPNPAAHWRPDVGAHFARAVEPVGWILRRSGPRQANEKSAGIVVATGGGGTPSTRAALYPILDDIIAQTRRGVGHRLHIRQALGPRAGLSTLVQADEVFDPGSALNDVFRAADLVISTAGYNSVLELASTDTPTLLVAIPRSLDDQDRRVRQWGSRLGHGLDPRAPEAATAWLVDQIAHLRRRPPVDPGRDGATGAAAVLLDLLCPVS